MLQSPALQSQLDKSLLSRSNAAPRSLYRALHQSPCPPLRLASSLLLVGCPTSHPARVPLLFIVLDPPRLGHSRLPLTLTALPWARLHLFPGSRLPSPRPLCPSSFHRAASGLSRSYPTHVLFGLSCLILHQTARPCHLPPDPPPSLPSQLHTRCSPCPECSPWAPGPKSI